MHPHASAPLTCHRCGAALAPPVDPRAFAARCVYCNADTMLPPHILAARQAEFAAVEQRQRIAVGQETAKKLAGGVMLGTVLVTVVPLVITLVVFVVVGVAVFLGLAMR